MGSMVGADVHELRSLAASFERAATQLRQTSTTVRNGIQISAWVGPFAIRFRRMWDSEHSVQLDRAAVALSAQARQLRLEADQQEHASKAAGGATGTRPDGSPAPRTGTDTRSLLATDPDAGDGNGVRIQKVRGEDGKGRVIVHIMGTVWGGDEDGNFGVTENATAASGGSTRTMAMIQAELEAAGVDGDDEVLFIGYSQGGLHAQNLARSGLYGDAMVITRGSPEVAGGMGDHDILRFEVEGDVVVENISPFDAAHDIGGAFGLRGSGTDLVVRDDGGAGARSIIDVIGVAGRQLAIHTEGDAFYGNLADGFDDRTDADARHLQRRIHPFLGGAIVEDSDG
jgi:hypothetical protein